MVLHKIINSIEYKYCGVCKKWKILDEFGNDKNTGDKKKYNCITCRNSWKKICTYENCETYAVHNYNVCKKHGGGRKCILCETPARNNSDYCIKHNPNICKYEKCKEKPIDDTDYCSLHNEIYRCKFEGCLNGKAAKRNGFCKTHGEKIYCIIENCQKIIKRGQYCDEHYCDGIFKCAKILLHRMTQQDQIAKRITTLTVESICEMYNKNQKCHWCDHELKLKCGGEFDLEKITVDRIKNELAHIDGNCVLSCLFCNYAKNSCDSDIWKSVINILQGKINKIDFRKFSFKKYGMAYTSFKNTEINTNWVKTTLVSNNFKCAVTGLPMYPTYEKYFPFGPSVDRINNNNKSHTKDNCRLTCRFINLGRNRMDEKKFNEWFKKRFPNIKIDQIIYPKDFEIFKNDLEGKYK